MSVELENKRAVLEWKRIVKTAKANARPDSNKKVTVATLTDEMNTILADEKLPKDVSEGVVNHWFSEASKDPHEKLRVPRRAEHCWALIRALERFGAWETVDERERERAQLQLTELVKLPRVPATWGRAGAPNVPSPAAVRFDHVPVLDTITALETHLMRVAGQEGLFCIDYRERPMLPQVPGYGRAAAAAIVGGAHFAMFQPFGADFPEEPGCHVFGVRNYLGVLCHEVRQAFRVIRQTALDTASEGEKAAVRKRIALYEFQRTGPFTGSGIQTRLLCSVTPGSRDDKTDTWTTEIGDLISTGKGDELVQRTNATNAEEIAAQFFPVIQYWKKHRRLPIDLVAACEEFAAGEEVQLIPGTAPWAVWVPGSEGGEGARPTARRK